LGALNHLGADILSFIGWVVLWHLFMGVGITIGYHRLLTHQGFKTHPWVEYIFVTLGYLALQGPPAHWVAVHRIHHAYSDKPLDPHSPVQKGWYYGQIGWIFDKRYEEATQSQTFSVLDITQNAEGKIPAYCNKWAPDLVGNRYYRLLERADVFWTLQLISLAIAFMVGGPISLMARILATFTSFSSTGWVNSFCHLPCFGANAPFAQKTKDGSKNVWWVALVSMGEGWHNNHHAFQRSAAHGLHWWQIDGSWYIIKTLKALGLVWNVYRPDQGTILKSLNNRLGPESQGAPEKEALLSA
jgi:fatty-acid desaturase